MSEINETEKNELAIKKREQFEASLSNNGNLWGYSALGLESKKAAMTMLSTKHGLYASVPIICKGMDCPYASSCRILQADLAPLAEPCPIEVAQIENRYLAYCEDFDLENSSFTDNVIVNEIIETDIMLERCKRLISEEMLPIQDVVVTVTEEGDAVTAPQVSKTIELNERLSRKRTNLFNLMRATRKDKKGEVATTMSLTDVLTMAIAREENQEFVINTRPDNFK